MTHTVDPIPYRIHFQPIRKLLIGGGGGGGVEGGGVILKEHYSKTSVNHIMIMHMARTK